MSKNNYLRYHLNYSQIHRTSGLSWTASEHIYVNLEHIPFQNIFAITKQNARINYFNIDDLRSHAMLFE